MQKFLFKFFILFVAAISILFFGLISFQKMSTERSAKRFIEPDFKYIDNMSLPSPPAMEEEPPIFIPALFIIFLSGYFVFILLKHLDKNYISPLIEIESKIGEIKEGSLDIEFKTKSEDKTVLETFDILNSMVLGLKEKERLRENFIAMLSHDLRTPVLAQERAISILKDEFGSHELLDGIGENNEEYLRMINLIVETFNAKDVIIKKETFNLSELTDNVMAALKGAAVNNNITVIKEIPKNFSLRADYISFHRIFMNLISNSIDNAGYGKTVKISALKDGDKNIITISDNGSGIDEDTLKHVFDKYACFKKGNKNKTVSGLGLYIASELVKKNDGTIRVETEKGAYTKFIIEI